MTSIDEDVDMPDRTDQSPPGKTIPPSLSRTQTQMQLPAEEEQAKSMGEYLARRLSDIGEDYLRAEDVLNELEAAVTPCQLDEHARTLIDEDDDDLLTYFAMLVIDECSCATHLLTALALLERTDDMFGSAEQQLGRVLKKPLEESRPILAVHLDRMLFLLCSGKVSRSGAGCTLGRLVACADSRYTTLSIYDLLDDWYHRHRHQSPKVRHSEQRWSRAWGVLGAMERRAERGRVVQLNRMNLAVFESDEVIGVLMTHVDRYDYTRIDGCLRLSELAKEMDAVALSGPSVDVDCSPGAVAVPASPAGGSPSTPVATPDEQGWLCMSCGQRNADTAEACTNVHANGTACDAMRKEMAIPAPGTPRPRKPTKHIDMSGGSSQSYDSPGSASSVSPGGASSGSGRAPADSSGRARGVNTPARGKGRAGARGGRPSSTEAAPPQPMSVVAAPQPDVYDLEKQLEALVGMSELKDALRRFHKKCQNDVGMRAKGHEPLSQLYHMLLMGNPGTGKTTVARLLFHMLKSAGVLKSDAPFVEFKPSRAEGSALGEAGEKVQEEIEKARGGVLFADEAHQLTMHKDNIYGQQVASGLMNCLQDGGGGDETRRVIVIYAGYAAGMQTLMASDSGYDRRIRHRFTLPDYTPSELAEMFFLAMAKKQRRQGEGVTVAAVAAHIEACTNPEYRSKHNGSIAEMLFENTDEAMCDRRGGNFEGPLSYEAEDVELGAKALKAAFDKSVATAGPAAAAATALVATPAAAHTLATPDDSSSDETDDGEDARTEAFIDESPQQPPQAQPQQAPPFQPPAQFIPAPPPGARGPPPDMERIGQPNIVPEQWRCRNCGIMFAVPAADKRSDRWSKHRRRHCTHPESLAQTQPRKHGH